MKLNSALTSGGLLFAAMSALAQPADAPWPMERQNRWGTAKAPIGPTTYTTPWISQTITGSGVTSRPPCLGPNGVGYFSKWVETKVYKFDYNTGQIFGTYQPPAPQFCLASPAMVSEANVIGMDSGNNQSKVFSINTDSLFHYWVKVIGDTRNGDSDHASPILGPDQSVLVADRSGNAYRLNPATGAEIWKATGLQGSYRTVAMTADDLGVIVPNGSQVTRLNFETGQVVWTKPIGSEAGGVCVAPSGEILVGSASGFVYCLNPGDGSQKWKYQTFAEARPAPAVDGDSVYICSLDQYLYRVNLSDGIATWGIATPSTNWSAPIVGHDGRVYFASRNSDVYCISPAGTQIWKINVNEEVRGPLALGADGTVYVPTTGSRGLAFIRQKPAQISGYFRLPEVVSDAFPYPATLRIWNSGNTSTSLETIPITINADGSFAVEWIPPYQVNAALTGKYDVTIQPKHVLRKRFVVDLADTVDRAIDFTGINGDADGDNVVGMFDYLLLSGAFDSNRGEAAYKPGADFDEDGTISLFDYLILSGSFDKSGDK